jgi:predicted Zn-dependent peptidase
MLKMQAEMERLYGSIFDCHIVKKGEQQILQLYFEGIPAEDNFTQGMSFLLEAMLHPLTDGNAFYSDFTEIAKDNLRASLNGRINAKGEYALQRCFEEMCKDEPFGIFVDGRIEDVDSLDAAGLCAHYGDMLRTAPIDFICLGNVNADTVTDMLTSAFAEPRTPQEPPEAVLRYSPKEAAVITENMNSNQGKICMGFRSKTPPTGRPFYACLMVNELLGGGPYSKLFTRIREKESLCYYINSVLYRFKSIIMVQSGVAAENFGRVKELVLEELKAIQNDDISRTEWDSALAGLIKKFISGRDYQPAVLDFYCAQYLLGDSTQVEELIDGLKAVTPDEVADAAGGLYLDTVFELE